MYLLYSLFSPVLGNSLSKLPSNTICRFDRVERVCHICVPRFFFSVDEREGSFFYFFLFVCVCELADVRLLFIDFAETPSALNLDCPAALSEVINGPDISRLMPACFCFVFVVGRGFKL